MILSLRRALVLALGAAALAPASASAAVTRTSVTTPAHPAYAVYEPMLKAAQAMTVAGTTDGAAGDLVDLVCTDAGAVNRLLSSVALDKDGRFSVDAPLKGFQRHPCTLRAVPYKYAGKEFDAFTGPTVAVTSFRPDAETTPVRGSDRPVTMDYEVETGHTRGRAYLRSAAGGALQRNTWLPVAAVGTPVKDDRNAIEIDGAAAYAAADIPRFASGEDRLAAPAGYEGVHATLALDERTGGVVVTESQRIVRCKDTAAPRPVPEDCSSVLDTGVRLERKIAFTDEHALADVKDRWVSTDARPHRLRLVYTHGVGETERPLWRFPGDPRFASYDYPVTVTPSGPGTVLLYDGSAFGALSYDPAPALFAFFDPRSLGESIEPTVPAGSAAAVRRSFAVADTAIAAKALVGRYAKPAPENGRTPDNPPDARPEQPKPQPVKRCQVPTVKTGATLKSVKAALGKAGCKSPRKTRSARSRTVRRGRVIALTRKAGATLPEGTAIGIKVSAGKPRRR